MWMRCEWRESLESSSRWKGVVVVAVVRLNLCVRYICTHWDTNSRGRENYAYEKLTETGENQMSKNSQWHVPWLAWVLGSTFEESTSSVWLIPLWLPCLLWSKCPRFKSGFSLFFAHNCQSQSVIGQIKSHPWWGAQTNSITSSYHVFLHYVSGLPARQNNISVSWCQARHLEVCHRLSHTVVVLVSWCWSLLAVSLGYTFIHSRVLRACASSSVHCCCTQTCVFSLPHLQSYICNTACVHSYSDLECFHSLNSTFTIFYSQRLSPLAQINGTSICPFAQFYLLLQPSLTSNIFPPQDDVERLKTTEVWAQTERTLHIMQSVALFFYMLAPLRRPPCYSLVHLHSSLALCNTLSSKLVDFQRHIVLSFATLSHLNYLPSLICRVYSFHSDK